MSAVDVMSTRTAIAAALSAIRLTVDGRDVAVLGRTTQPATFSAWQAWPVWQNTEWINRCVDATTWSVLVVLPPGDVETWVEATESVLDPIRDALEASVGHVQRAEPVALSSGDANGTMPAVSFTLTTNS